MLNVSRTSVPEIDALGKSDSENVVFAPANEIEVVVVNDIGSIQDTKRSAGYLAKYLFSDRKVRRRIEVCSAKFHGAQRVVFKGIVKVQWAARIERRG